MSPAAAATAAAVTIAPPPTRDDGRDRDGDRRRALFAGFGPIEGGVGGDGGGDDVAPPAVDADFSAFAASARSLDAGDADDDLVVGDLREEREGATSSSPAVEGEGSEVGGVMAVVGVDGDPDGASASASAADGVGTEDGGERRMRKYVTPADFELLTVIGMGAFGKVLQVRNRRSKQILAMKVISKRLLRRRANHIRQMQLERDILTRIRHPFIVTMHCSFQTPQKLFLVMDFLAGGELFLRLGREGVFLEKTAAFYLAEIVLALEHLHNHHILHRDLKPENVLLGSDGHVCLTDFGLAKDFTVDEGWSASSATASTEEEEEESVSRPTDRGDPSSAGVPPPPPPSSLAAPPTSPLPGRAKTICGTTEYMAPEMIAKKGYGRAADYWSLGCIAYEMLSGTTPFHSRKGERDVLRKILSERVRMPDGASAAACKLLKGLLHRNPLERLGAARGSMFQIGGVAGLKQCQFFQKIRWDRLEAKEIDPPATFAVDGDDDLRHFHDEFKSMRLPRSVTEIVDDPDYLPRRCESENFRGFSFVQDDFVLPERGSREYESYWNNPDAECESLSECASSVVSGDSSRGGAGGSAKDGAEGAADPGGPEAATTTPKKKRPPRKRKKKKNGPAAAAALSTDLESTPEGGPHRAEEEVEHEEQRTPPSAVVAAAPPAEANPKPPGGAEGGGGGTVRSDADLNGGKTRFDAAAATGGSLSPGAAAPSPPASSGGVPQSRSSGHGPSAAYSAAGERAEATTTTGGAWRTTANGSSPRGTTPASTTPARAAASQESSKSAEEAWAVQRPRRGGKGGTPTTTRSGLARGGGGPAASPPASRPSPPASGGAVAPHRPVPGTWAARTASVAANPSSSSRTGTDGSWNTAAAVIGASTGSRRAPPTTSPYTGDGRWGARGRGPSSSPSSGVGPHVGGGRPAIATQPAFWPSLGSSTTTTGNGVGGSAGGANPVGDRGGGGGGGGVGGGGGTKAMGAWSTNGRVGGRTAAPSSVGGGRRSPTR